MIGPGAHVPAGDAPRVLFPRLACVIGAEGRIGGYTLFARVARSQNGSPPKEAGTSPSSRPCRVTPDELDPTASTIVVRTDGREQTRDVMPPFDWQAAIAFAAAGTTLRSGDVIAGPSLCFRRPRRRLGGADLPGIGVLAQFTA